MLAYITMLIRLFTVVCSERLCSLQHDGAFYAFAVQGTADFIDSADASAGVIGICRTTAAAMKLGKAGAAFGP